MSRLWDADVELSTEGAAGLIEAQFPELAPVRLEMLGEGWDNTAYRVNERIAFRFPRRRVFTEGGCGARLLATETRALPLLAPHLPLPIPVPAYARAPGGGYPYSFAGYPYLSGTSACDLAWSEEERARNAAPLGQFLAALHYGISLLEYSVETDDAAVRAAGDYALRAASQGYGL